jgi:hypothetical protein
VSFAVPRPGGVVVDSVGVECERRKTEEEREGRGIGEGDIVGRFPWLKGFCNCLSVTVSFSSGIELTAGFWRRRPT